MLVKNTTIIIYNHIRVKVTLMFQFKFNRKSELTTLSTTAANKIEIITIMLLKGKVRCDYCHMRLYYVSLYMFLSCFHNPEHGPPWFKRDVLLVGTGAAASVADWFTVQY